MNFRNLFAALILAAAGLSACNRKENDNAGKGGNALLRVVPKHHAVSKHILNGIVYIKYNAQDIPASFDDSASCIWIGGVPTASFPNLKKGKYYLMGKGFDSSIKQNVQGGIPYEILEESTIEISVPVTEVHD